MRAKEAQTAGCQAGAGGRIVPPYSTSTIVCRMLCPMLVPGFKGEKKDDKNWRNFRKDDFRSLKGL